jgi:hypothetical protein
MYFLLLNRLTNFGFEFIEGALSTVNAAELQFKRFLLILELVDLRSAIVASLLLSIQLSFLDSGHFPKLLKVHETFSSNFQLCCLVCDQFFERLSSLVVLDSVENGIKLFLQFFWLIQGPT